MILDPAQYYNYTQPMGNHVPFTNYKRISDKECYNGAGPQELINTFHMPSGNISIRLL